MEQNNGEIFTCGRRSTVPLEKLQVWQNSSAVFFVHAPESVQSVSVLIGDEAIEAKYDIHKKCWRVYVGPLYLTSAGTFNYTVKAIDECANPTILGSGTLEIVASPIPSHIEGGGGQGIIPSRSYAYNPLTGKYHKLIATQDEAGVITISVNQTGELL